MLVKVHYYAMLREITGKKQEEFIIENNIKFSKFLKNLADNYGDALGNKIYENHGQHRNYLIYLINGRNIHSEEMEHGVGGLGASAGSQGTEVFDGYIVSGFFLQLALGNLDGFLIVVITAARNGAEGRRKAPRRDNFVPQQGLPGILADPPKGQDRYDVPIAATFVAEDVSVDSQVGGLEVEEGQPLVVGQGLDFGVVEV